MDSIPAELLQLIALNLPRHDFAHLPRICKRIRDIHRNIITSYFRIHHNATRFALIQLSFEYAGRPIYAAIAEIKMHIHIFLPKVVVCTVTMWLTRTYTKIINITPAIPLEFRIAQNRVSAIQGFIPGKNSNLRCICNIDTDGTMKIYLDDMLINDTLIFRRQQLSFRVLS